MKNNSVKFMKKYSPDGSGYPFVPEFGAKDSSEQQDPSP
jgi:hypothetical protein